MTSADHDRAVLRPSCGGVTANATRSGHCLSAPPVSVHDECVDAVWERFLVTVDQTVLVDEHGTVQQRWPQDAGDRLFDELVLGGVPLTYNESLREPLGRADCVDLFVAAAAGQVLVATNSGPPRPVRAELCDLVCDWYAEFVDGT